MKRSKVILKASGPEFESDFDDCWGIVALHPTESGRYVCLGVFTSEDHADVTIERMHAQFPDAQLIIKEWHLCDRPMTDDEISRR